MANGKTSAFEKFKTVTEPFLCIIPVVFIFIVQFFSTRLYIPNLKLNINEEIVFRIMQFFCVIWMFIPPFRKSCKTYGQQLALYLLPVEIMTAFILAQYNFWLVVGLFACCIILSAICCKMIFTNIRKKTNRKVKLSMPFARATIVISTLVLSVALVGGSAALFTQRPLVKPAVKTQAVSVGKAYDLDYDIIKTFSILYDPAMIISSDQERADALQAVMNLEHAYLTVKPLELKIVKLSGKTLGECDYEKGIIYVDYEHLSESGARSLINTVCHEIYHAYEYTVVEHLNFSDEFVQTSVFYARPRAWNENFQNYISFENDEEGYFEQIVESDARNYAESRADYYIKQLERYYEQLEIQDTEMTEE